MGSFTAYSDQRYSQYNLYGVSNHYGTMEGGHYTAYCRNNVYGQWYKFDDQEVSELSTNDVRTGAAYILFYASTAVNYKVIRICTSYANNLGMKKVEFKASVPEFAVKEEWKTT
uniref:ubiquitinyl hydrolase 1 n=1 Tax=Timema cristinae TaxID=61476 RepID=A0A7R9CMX0_TIMCR|nr:unnamed protein product [Timema cristinae]